MKLWYLPFVREGMSPTSLAGTRAHVPVTLGLESPGRASLDVSRTMPLLGPGDVITVEPRQVLRVTPASGTRDAETDFFPSIEFDAPDLPWAYSPVVPDSVRVAPWMLLIVVEATPDVTLAAGDRGQSPWMLRMPGAVASRELPELTDTWAWAHAQVACEAPGDITGTLGQYPDRTLSRLIAPRRLVPFRSYRACVVPAFLSGLVAGLGGDPADEPLIVTGQEPAWSSTRVPPEIPVYYTWTFRTGEAGDFESLAQRLRAAPLDAAIPATPLHLSLPKGDGQLTVDWEAPLRVPGAKTRPRRPGTAASQIRRALRPSGVSRPVLGPTYFGSSWTDQRTLDPLTHWGAELNLTPMLRAAAGLGAETVRGEQETLVTAVSDQLEAFRAQQREGRRRQLATVVVNRVKHRLANTPEEELARVLAPMVAASQRSASNVGLYTAAGRRILRKGAFAVVKPPIGGVDGGVTAPRPDTAVDVTSAVPLEGDAPLIPEVKYRPIVERHPVVKPSAPVPPVDAAAIPTGVFAPRFARPMSEPLAERHPELMLPGTGSIAADGVVLVESNPAFVEAFLVGANQELNYELLWRGLPADTRATAFRRFWNHADGGDDINDIPTWDATTPVGGHVMTNVPTIILVRSELVRRYPTVLVAAVPAVWNGDGTRSPAREASALVLPAFRGRVGADVLYAGFPRPSLTDAVGVNTDTGPAGWFFLFSENVGDPRFGLDAHGRSATPTRATTLAWTHLNLPADARYATVASLPDVADAKFTREHATAASVAGLTRQRPARAFLHASLLVRLPGA